MDENNLFDLIEIDEANKTVSARDLWNYLGQPWGDFNHWINKYLLKEQYGFVESIDFASFYTVINNNRQVREYNLSIHCSKEISMLQRTKKGKEARKYFIEVEKRFLKIKKELMDQMPKTLLEAGELWVNEMKKNKVLTTEKLQLENKIETDKEKVDFADHVTDTSDCLSVGDFAKLIGTGQKRLFKWLRSNHFLTKNNTPYQKYIEMGFFKAIEEDYNKKDEKKIYIKTLITGKGQISLHKYWICEDLLLNN